MLCDIQIGDTCEPCRESVTGLLPTLVRDTAVCSMKVQLRAPFPAHNVSAKKGCWLLIDVLILSGRRGCSLNSVVRLDTDASLEMDLASSKAAAMIGKAAAILKPRPKFQHFCNPTVSSLTLTLPPPPYYITALKWFRPYSSQLS